MLGWLGWVPVQPSACHRDLGIVHKHVIKTCTRQEGRGEMLSWVSQTGKSTAPEKASAAASVLPYLERPALLAAAAVQPQMKALASLLPRLPASSQLLVAGICVIYPVV